ncbi:MAG: hypothetical protein AVDCRST_MAG26-397 [uncultured Chloroflexia bacterium]|uniref:TIGR02588 family protein n=1 Tax=uncultured Chloroflexia bacterium TaxID=1672391 RepID=A0A6J4HAH9_9CHLR|nr:MAG: hypothetical protein AVDCRST_MAG26-397 [uncultured Chloroflexia bacterium]
MSDVRRQEAPTSAQQGASRAEPSQSAQDSPRSAAEWVTLAAVLLILGVVVGYLVLQTVRRTDDTAHFEVEIRQGEIEQHGDRFYVPLTIRNAGAATGEEVVVHAELKRGSETVEETELTFGFIAGGEEMEGVVIFAEDPRSAELEAYVVGYLKP